MTINRNGPTASTQHVCTGPIAVHTDGFSEFLAGEGYAVQTVKGKRALVAHLSQWLKRRRLPLAKLDEERLKRFRADHRDSTRRGDVSTGHQLLEFFCAASEPFLRSDKK